MLQAYLRRRKLKKYCFMEGLPRPKQFIHSKMASWAVWSFENKRIHLNKSGHRIQMVFIVDGETTAVKRYGADSEKVGQHFIDFFGLDTFILLHARR